MSRPKNDDSDLEVRAAWYYYMHGMGQEQVARALDISRTKVTRLLSRARETGMVRITLDHEMAETLALSDWIARSYGLKQCLLAPPPPVEAGPGPEAEEIGRQAVGMVAANLLARRLQGDPGLKIGIGGGRTLARTAAALRPMNQSGARVVSLIGSASLDDGTSAWRVAQTIAETLGGTARILPVPLIVGNPQTRRVLEEDPVVREVLDLGHRTAINLLGCGAVEEAASFSRVSGLTGAELAGLRSAGAVCEVAGLHLTADGRLAESEVNERRIGVPLSALTRDGTVIVASGRRKAAPLLAAIRAGIAQTIVIDQEIAGILAEKA